MEKGVTTLDYAIGLEDFSGQAGEGERGEIVDGNPFGERGRRCGGARGFVWIVAGAIAPIFIIIFFAEVIAGDVDRVVGDGDGVTEGAPVAVARGSGREIGGLREFPHSSHEGCALGTLH